MAAEQYALDHAHGTTAQDWTMVGLGVALVVETVVNLGICEVSDETECDTLDNVENEQEAAIANDAESGEADWQGADVLSEAPEFRANTTHIFRDSPGHFMEDTPANREAILDVIRPGNEAGDAMPARFPSVGTVQQYGAPKGTPGVWAQVLDGKTITNAGINP
jgi:hypothetical protein